ASQTRNGLASARFCALVRSRHFARATPRSALTLSHRGGDVGPKRAVSLPPSRIDAVCRPLAAASFRGDSAPRFRRHPARCLPPALVVPLAPIQLGGSELVRPGQRPFLIWRT